MRKISTFLFAASFVFLGLTSCSDDDSTSNPEPQPTDMLLGKWNLETVSVKISVDGEVIQEIKDQSVSPVVMTFDFKADNKVEYFYYEPEEEEQEYEEKLSGTYQKEGNKLIITIENEPVDFTILVNDKSDLHLGMSFEETYKSMVIKQETEQKFVKM